MTVILGMNDLLLDTDLDETQRRLAEGVARASNSLLALINDILDLSKIEAGKQELVIGDFELASLVSDVVAMLSGTGVSKGLDRVARCDGDVPGVVRGDASRLPDPGKPRLERAQVHRPGGVVLQVSRPCGEVVRFEVSDTGIGIAPEDQWRTSGPSPRSTGRRVDDPAPRRDRPGARHLQAAG